MSKLLSMETRLRVDDRITRVRVVCHTCHSTLKWHGGDPNPLVCSCGCSIQIRGDLNVSQVGPSGDAWRATARIVCFTCQTPIEWNFGDATPLTCKCGCTIVVSGSLEIWQDAGRRSDE